MCGAGLVLAERGTELLAWAARRVGVGIAQSGDVAGLAGGIDSSAMYVERDRAACAGSPGLHCIERDSLGKGNAAYKK